MGRDNLLLELMRLDQAHDFDGLIAAAEAAASPTDRHDAALALNSEAGMAHFTRAMDLLERFIEDADGEVRHAAASALAGLAERAPGSERVKRLLLKGLHDPRRDTARLAALGLVALEPALAVEDLRHLAASHPDGWVRRRLLRRMIDTDGEYCRAVLLDGKGLGDSASDRLYSRWLRLRLRTRAELGPRHQK